MINDNLTRILKELNIDSNLKKLIFNEVNIPYLDDYNQVDKHWYPHPPCLIPFFLGYGASYKGIIHHFFVDRNNTLVELNLEYGSIIEKAFNFKQLSVYLILPMIMSEEGITDEIITFANQIDFKECKEIDEFSITYGDNTEFFNEMVHFKNNLPLDIINDITQYKGDFPCSYDNFNQSQINNTCSFELSPTVYEKIKAQPTTPKWLLKENNKKELFENYIANNQLKEAWLTLNSKGWHLQEVAEGLEILKTKTNDDLFHLVANNWIQGWEKSTFKHSNF